jgi:alanine racemase
MTRPTWIEIDLDALRYNVRALVEEVAPAELCAVVKADGYGHGDVPVAEAALEAGATVLAVALVEEGVRLREAGITAPILLLSQPPIAGIPRINRWALTPTVYTLEFVAALEASRETSVAVHLKVDTGMHRVGAVPQTALDIARYLGASELLELGGIWTHFASAEWDRDFTAVQTQRFQDFVNLLADEDINPGLLHCANTAGALFSPEARMDMVRVGLGIYGLQPSQESQPVALRPAMRVVSEVSHVARYSAGERLSYGRTKPLMSDTWVATVPIGYADGYERRLSEQGAALIGGVRCAFAGTVTMDQILLIVDKEPSVGDEVVLLGTQGDDAITAEAWAQWLGTINYEVVCGMGSRLPRRFIRSQVRGSV